MEEHSHTPWVIAIIISLIIGIGAGSSVGLMIGRQQKVPTKVVKQSAADGVNVGDTRVVPTKDIADNLSAIPDASTFLGLFETAGLKDYLHNVGPYTVVVPTNSSFDLLDKSQFEQIKASKDTSQLKKLILNNVVAGTYTTADLRLMSALNQSIKSLAGESLTIKIDNNKVELIDGAGGVALLSPTDAISANGVIQISNHVLTPASMKTLQTAN